MSNLSGKKVLVTGGAGFIGSHLCEELVERKAEVVCLDDFSAGKMENVRFLMDHSNFHVVRKSVCDTDGMDALFDGVDTVFHNAASKKNVCLINPQKDLTVNGGGTLNLLEYAVKHKIRKFVHASTGSVYGEPSIFPTDETHPLRPVSYYGVSKLAGERYVDVFHHLYGLNTTILRYFHVYGPRQESNEFGGVVSIFFRNIIEGKPLIVFGHGEQIRSFTWVKDLVQANLAAMDSEKAIGSVYNVASGIKVSINELAERLSKMFPNPVPILHGEPLVGDIMRFDVSNERITRELGVSFETDFWGTLGATVDQFVSYLESMAKSGK